MNQQIEIKALGRPVQLGQLYDASKSQFRNELLFKRKEADATIKMIPKKSTNFEYKEVRSLEDRADMLEISGSLSVSIFSGAVTIGGYGSYLDRKDESSQSTTIAAVVRIRTEHKYIDTQSLHEVVRLDDEDIEFIGATHVVTGITYGGNTVGNITERKTRTDSERHRGIIQPRPSSQMSRREISTDKMSQKFVGIQGVPCDIILTPLSRFNKFKVISKFRESEDADLKSISDFCNRIVNLQVNRRATCQQLDGDLSDVEGEARKALRESGDENTTADNFVRTNEPEFDSEQKLYERDSGILEDLLEKRRTADEHNFKLLQENALHAEMNRQDKATVALVLIPEVVGIVSLLNIYRLFAGLIKKWQEDIRKIDSSSAPFVYHSLYVDPKIIGEFRSLTVTSGPWRLLSRLSSREENPHSSHSASHEAAGRKAGGTSGMSMRNSSRQPTKTRLTLQKAYSSKIDCGRMASSSKQGCTKTIVLLTMLLSLRKGDAVSSHISKIAKVLGFIIGQKYRIKLNMTGGGVLSVHANGYLIDPSEVPGLGSSSWPLNAAKEIEIERLD
ncbi:hypothetical protein AX15_002025 [Amanita polypyramis BW_CC]|nr:hypothetical protein AX15_002025 [Amanita polypyramis BW_CC]